MKKEFEKSRDDWKSMQQSQEISQNVEMSKMSNYKVKKIVPVHNSSHNNNYATNSIDN